MQSTPSCVLGGKRNTPHRNVPQAALDAIHLVAGEKGSPESERSPSGAMRRRFLQNPVNHIAQPGVDVKACGDSGARNIQASTNPSV